MSTPQTAAFHTLGCKLNFSETSSIAQRFEQKGYRIVEFDEAADIYVINTCSVTDFADAKCRNIVRKSLRINPDAKVIVVGCYAQLKPREIAEIEGVDLVLGAAEKFRILDYVDEISHAGKGWVQAGEIEEVNSFQEAFSFGDRTRSFLKVQDGCSYNCSFCTIPLARGKSRSPSIATVIRNAEELANKGVKEVVLTGVNIGDFGLPANGSNTREATFLDLIRALEMVEGIERFRISSIEPNLCSDEIITWVAQSQKFVPHFHIPLQSGDNEMLGKMRRRYRKELYRDRVASIKSAMPHACIGVDVIVGFPGETEKHFQNTLDFLEPLPVSYFHVFTYSERPNTHAEAMEGAIPMQERKRRNKMLRRMSRKKKLDFYRSHIGEMRQVLVEKSRAEDQLSGFTDNYIKVQLPADQGDVNQIIPCQLESLSENGTIRASVGKPELQASSR